MPDNQKRCAWVGEDDLYRRYHDEEWGIPVHDDRKLFEMLVLEGAQAGLSWLTILKKRAGYRQAFANFEIDQILKYDDKKLEELRLDEGIVRNRLKIKSVLVNAQAFKEVQKEYGSFDNYLWSYVDWKPILNHWQHLLEVPAQTPLSDQISQDLKKRGFKFVGSTIIYAYLQAVGVVNDHVVDCDFRRV